jgi:hypothetical protein
MDASLASFYSQEDLDGLKNLITNGSLTVVMNGEKFWVQVYRDELSGNFLAPDGTQLTNSSFNNLVLGSVSDPIKSCMTLSYQSATGSFLAEEVCNHLLVWGCITK